MTQKGRPVTLAEYFARGIETQEALARRCEERGRPVSQAHLSRVAGGGGCSIGLAKLLSELTGVPVESFGEAA